jgi:hypothetical protein
MTSQPITVKLDRVRAVRWTMRAQARNASLARPVSFATLAKPRNSIYAMAAILWASLVDKDHEFEAPEDLAEYLTTEEQQLAAIKAVSAMVNEAFPEKKSPVNESLSSNGEGQLSKPDSAQAAQTTGI